MPITAEAILDRSDSLRRQIGGEFRDRMVGTLYENARQIASRSVRETGAEKWDFDQRVDRLVTSRHLGLPLMMMLLGLVFWITILGANVPSQMLANAFFGVEAAAAGWFESLGSPWWLTGLLWHGVFRSLAWVVSVMLPPMAIFFPVFTILEDLGYLPRVAFNLDWLFRKAGAHGKQALTMAMGFGCNAAGVTSTRIIDSPRERLLAILTNNFVPCNGRFPTLIMLAVIFVAASFPPVVASVAAAGAVVGVVLLGIGFTLAVSWALSRSVLSGEASAFTLELPPYRPSQHSADPLHVADRPDHLRAGAGDAHGGSGRRGHLDPGQRPVRRLQPCLSGDRLAAATWASDRARRGDPAGVHHRYPRQRDRRADDAHVLPRGQYDDRYSNIR